MIRSVSFLLLAAGALAWSAPNAAAQCVTGGTGGAFPTSGTGDGSCQVTLPTFPLVATLSVTVPGGATVLNAVKLNGISHTYAGDIQLVLQNPAGTKFNLLTTECNDPNVDFNSNNFVIVDPIQSTGCAPVVQPFNWGVGAAVDGTYSQTYGTWTSGNFSITNTGIESIPISSGTWTLYIYDWVALDIGSLTSWDLCFGSPTPPPPPLGPPPAVVCVSGGASGAIPSTGTGDGTWPGTLPSAPMIGTLNVTVPSGANTLRAVKLFGLSHTWIGDMHVVLKNPAGQLTTVMHRPGGGPGVGLNCDPAGDYVIYDGCYLGNQDWNACSGGLHNPGQYPQYFGSWPSGSAGINNTPLSSFPISNGTWTLYVYDWAGGDIGSLTSWDLCFDGSSAPTAYCTAGTTTNGCVPSISATAQPSASLASACVINVANVEGMKSGLIFYGLSPLSPPVSWGTGSNSLLCVKAPTQRMTTQNSGGTASTCTGALVQDWNAFQTANPGSLGNPFSAGTHVYCQGWFRDPPAVKTTNLTDALDLTMGP